MIKAAAVMTLTVMLTMAQASENLTWLACQTIRADLVKSEAFRSQRELTGWGKARRVVDEYWSKDVVFTLECHSDFTEWGWQPKSTIVRETRDQRIQRQQRELIKHTEWQRHDAIERKARIVDYLQGKQS